MNDIYKEGGGVVCPHCLLCGDLLSMVDFPNSGWVCLDTFNLAGRYVSLE